MLTSVGMKTTLTSRTDTLAQLTVALTHEDLATTVKHVFDDLRPKVKAAGFRPGKAPDTIVERELGSAYVQNEVVEHAVRDSYARSIQQEDLPVVAPPQVSLEKFVPYTELEYKAEVELMPPVKLPEYQKFRIKRPALTVDPAEVDQMIEDLRRREAARIEVERAAANGDEAVIDFIGTKDGQPVSGAAGKNQTLMLGSGQFIPGFEDEVVGMKPAEEKTFDIRFPKDYHEKTLAGQVVTFAVKLHKLTELALPEANNEFAAKIGPFKTLDELRDDALQTITRQKTDTVSRDYEQLVLDKLIKESTYSVPEALAKQQLERLRTEMEQNLAYSGLNIEKYMELSNKTAETLDAEMRPEAERRVGLALVLTEVAKAEKIELTTEELDEELARLRGQYQDPATQAELNNPETREEMYNHLMASRVIAKLIGYAETK